MKKHCLTSLMALFLAFVMLFDNVEAVPLGSNTTSSFKIISPTADSKVVCSNRLNIQWKKHPKASYYKVYVLNDDAKKYTFGYKTKKTNITLPPYTLTGGCRQIIYIFAYNSKNKQLAKTKQKILVTGKIQKLGDFSVSTILNNNNLTYKWTKSQNASFYEYSVYDKTSKKNLSHGYISYNCTIKYNNLTKNHKYCVYITAYNGNPYRSKTISKSNATPTRYKTVKKDFSVLDIKSPANNAKIASSNKNKVEWTKYDDSSKYYVYSRDTKTNKFTCNYYTENTSFTLPKYALTANSKQCLCVMVKNSSNKTVAYRSINLNVTGSNQKPKNFDIDAKVNNKKITFSASCENATNYYYSLKDLTDNKYITKPTIKEKINNITRYNLDEKHKYEIMVVACNGNCYKNKNISYDNLDTSRITKKTLTLSDLTSNTENKTISTASDNDTTTSKLQNTSEDKKNTSTTNNVASTNNTSTTNNVVQKTTPTLSVSLNSLTRSSNTYTMSLGDATLKWKSCDNAKYYLNLYSVTDKKTLINGGILAKYCTNNNYAYTIKKSFFDYGKKYLVTMSLEDSDHKRANNTAIVDKFYIQVKSCVVKIGGAHGDFDNKSGDSSGNETSVTNFNNAWVYAIRAKKFKCCKTFSLCM